MKLDSNTRYLIYELAKRDIVSRYKGSVLGIGWSLITPIATLAVFTFVFAGIFQAKWHSSGSTVDFILNLYAGLIVFWYFAELLNKAPSLVSSQPNFIKKVVFPLEILPLVSVISALFQFCINILILFAAIFVYKGGIPIESVIALAIVVLCLSPLLLGIGWVLSAVGVYIKDIATVIGLVVNMLMFLSPIFYPIEAAPDNIRWVFAVNPLSFPIEWLRDGALLGEIPNLLYVGLFFVSSICIAWVGLKCFSVLKSGFADVV